MPKLVWQAVCGRRCFSIGSVWLPRTLLRLPVVVTALQDYLRRHVVRRPHHAHAHLLIRCRRFRVVHVQIVTKEFSQKLEDA